MDEGLSDGSIIAVEFRIIGEGAEDRCALRNDGELICAGASASGGSG